MSVTGLLEGRSPFIERSSTRAGQAVPGGRRMRSYRYILNTIPL
jgi:hypothetical protein